MQLQQFQPITWRLEQPKFRTTKTKKSPKFIESWVYGTTPPEFTHFSFNFTKVLASPILK